MGSNDRGRGQGPRQQPRQQGQGLGLGEGPLWLLEQVLVAPAWLTRQVGDERAR